MNMKRTFYVYILANWNNKVVYVGVTNNLQRRIYEHKNKLVGGFTTKYNVSKLVYVEQTSDVVAAIGREKQLKGWRRTKKNELIESLNPTWRDLSEEDKDPSQAPSLALRASARDDRSGSG